MTGPAATDPARERPRSVRSVGDRAVLVECAGPGEVLALHAHLAARPLPGQVQLVAAARTVLVELGTAAAAAAAVPALRSLAVVSTQRPPGRLIEIPTVYDGPDLAAVAAMLGTSVEAVVAAHGAVDWTAAFAGFAPGFVYLVRDDVPQVRRRDVPRPAVPAGSVALGGPYSAVYPRASPGGWQLIGRTDVVLWDLAAAPPALVRPGDRVRFTAHRTDAVPARCHPGRPGAGVRRAEADPHDAAAGGAGDAALVVVEPGPLTLVQDLGRPGLADLGVTRSGAADRSAARSANRLVGNDRTAAVLEAVGGGLRVRARGAVVLAVTGAVPVVHTSTGTVPAGRPFALPDGHEVLLPEPPTGLRTYVALRGGVGLAPVLGSRSRDVLAALGPDPLAAGDVVPVGPGGAGPVGTPEDREPPPAGLTVRIVAGPRADWVGDAGLDALCGTAWQVSALSNRVGLRLDGPPLVRVRDDDLASEGVVRGAVQVPPSGRPVVFGPDHPVTGGYPVVAVVVDADVDSLAQVRPGGVLRFERWTGPAGSRMLGTTAPDARAHDDPGVP